MKIRIVGSAVSGNRPYQFLLSYIVDDVVAIDAGSIGLLTPRESQSAIEHVFLSHSHIDHVASLPLFLDNVYEHGPQHVRVYGSPQTLDCLRQHFFNDRVWPDLIRLSSEESAFMQLIAFEPHRPVEVAGLSVTAVPLNHVVSTAGFIIANAEAAVAIVSDTRPSVETWETLAAVENLKAVFLEASFPDSMHWLAEKTGHLTVQEFGREVAQLPRDVEVVAVHLKPALYDEIAGGLEALGLENLVIGQPESEYVY